MASNQLEPIPEDPADSPTDLPSMIKWRGRSKARHTAAINKAIAAINSQGDRDHLRALRHNIVSAYEEVEERHNWLIQKRPALSEGETDKEATWLIVITVDQRKIISAIDNYIAPSSHRHRLRVIARDRQQNRQQNRLLLPQNSGFLKPKDRKRKPPCYYNK